MSKPFQFSMRRLFIAVALFSVFAWSVARLPGLSDDAAVVIGVIGAMSFGLAVQTIFKRRDGLVYFFATMVAVIAMVLSRTGSIARVIPPIFGLALVLLFALPTSKLIRRPTDVDRQKRRGIVQAVAGLFLLVIGCALLGFTYIFEALMKSTLANPQTLVIGVLLTISGAIMTLSGLRRGR
jgi:hypothetical protein